MASNPALISVKDRRFLNGFGVLFLKESRHWFGTWQWVVQVVIWLAIVNGMLAMVVLAAPKIEAAQASAEIQEGEGEGGRRGSLTNCFDGLLFILGNGPGGRGGNNRPGCDHSRAPKWNGCLGTFKTRIPDSIFVFQVLFRCVGCVGDDGSCPGRGCLPDLQGGYRNRIGNMEFPRELRPDLSAPTVLPLTYVDVGDAVSIARSSDWYPSGAGVWKPVGQNGAGIGKGPALESCDGSGARSSGFGGVGGPGTSSPDDCAAHWHFDLDHCLHCRGVMALRQRRILRKGLLLCQRKLF